MQQLCAGILPDADTTLQHGQTEETPESKLFYTYVSWYSLSLGAQVIKRVTMTSKQRTAAATEERQPHTREHRNAARTLLEQCCFFLLEMSFAVMVFIADS